MVYTHKPSSENDRKDGTKNDSLEIEWLTLRHFWLNHPSSAWYTISYKQPSLPAAKIRPYRDPTILSKFTLSEGIVNKGSGCRCISPKQSDPTANVKYTQLMWIMYYMIIKYCTWYTSSIMLTSSQQSLILQCQWITLTL